MNVNKVNFDDYSDSYDELMQQQHAKFGDISYYSDYKVNILKSIFKDFTSNLKILEYGCGIGRNLHGIQDLFFNAEVFAYDISNESAKIAKKNNPSIVILSEEWIADNECFFDIIFIAGVFHHIPPRLRDSVTQRLFKLLKKRGSIVIFEHNPYNPVTQHMVSTCEFDNDAVLLSKKETINLFLKQNFILIKSNYVLFVPPKLKALNFFEKFVGWLPLGGQFYVVFSKK